MKILKFGGTSVATADRIALVASLAHAAQEASPTAVVVSAMGGITDLLLRAGHMAEDDIDASLELIEEAEERHLEAVREGSARDDVERLLATVASAFAGLKDLLRGVSLVGECSARTLDRILSHGELLSVELVASSLRRRGCFAQPCDARRLIVTDRNFGNARVDLEATQERVEAHFGAAQALQVVTGFISQSRDGETTTLGRGGSDLTAALLGACLDAEAIEIWTDVDGVLSADPRLVPDAFPLSELSYEELMELSHFGAKVVYPPTVQPARAKGIPLLIKNTFHADSPGTRVLQSSELDAQSRSGRPITGISSIHNVTLVRLEGDGMVGIPGIAGRLFGALARASVSVILISQASSEHSICFAIDPSATAQARSSVEREFALERQTGLLSDLVVEPNQCIVAVVGEGMRDRPGLAARLFRVLGRRQINVRAIAQGSSELNISLVLARKDEGAAVRAIHDSFFRPEDRVLKLFVAGVGTIGSPLLQQLFKNRERIRAQKGIEIHLEGVTSSRYMVLSRDKLEAALPSDWRAFLAAEGEPASSESFAAAIASHEGVRVLVDCTASDAVPQLYEALLEKGGAIVTANKKPLSATAEAYRRLLAARRTADRGLYYETTVGAGLPVVHTLQALLYTGDRVTSLAGVFSGTLAYLFSELARGTPFSDAIREAHRLGLTEPDPREDLSGRDVCRKLLILARECQVLQDEPTLLEWDDVDLEPLLERHFAELSLDDFWQQLPTLDSLWGERMETARKRGNRLVYLATYGAGGGKIGLEEVPQDHPAASNVGTDNVFLFHTERYHETPVVVKGPGAGPQVTAAGLFSDILRAHAEAVRDPLIEVQPRRESGAS